MLKPISFQQDVMQRMMTPAAYHSITARPELPLNIRILRDCVKIPLPIVLFIIRQKMEKGPRSWLETSNRYV